MSMSHSNAEHSVEERFSSLLASFESEISAGLELDGSRFSELTHESLGERLKNASQCLRLLKQVWPAAESQPQPGQLQEIARFEIIRELGRGGFGVVYLAFDP